MSPASPASQADAQSVYSGQMTIRPASPGLSAARRQLSRVARYLCIADEKTADLLIAFGEALSNAYRHGSPDARTNLIYIGWRFSGEVLTVTVKDEGDGFVPRKAACRLAEAAASRGHGIRLMRQGVDEVYFKFEGGAKVVLKKRISPIRTEGTPRQ